MESAAKRPKVDGQEAAATTNADTSNQAATDFFPLEHLPAEIFPSITASLSHQDIVHLSEVRRNKYFFLFLIGFSIHR
jgi:hypothetical protein